MKERLIPRDKSIIVACDVAGLESLKTLVEKTYRIEGIGGYKVGLELVIGYGLTQVVDTVKELTDLPLIYDHQKGGIDTSETGKRFAEACRKTGVDAVILFPFGGAESEKSWINACLDKELVVLVGAHMTERGFLEDEGGFIADSAPERILITAAQNGVRDFVVPGNKVKYVKEYRDFLAQILGEGNFALYAPGFITQGGNINQVGRVAGQRWHAIVGRAIYRARNVEETARMMVREMLSERKD